MANPVVLQLEELMFPVQEVRTHPAHNLQGDRAGTKLNFAQEVQKLDAQPGKYGLMVSIRTDEQNSVNPPYSFTMDAYAIFAVSDSSGDTAADAALVLASGFPVVIGAMRERLADLTARAPWGRFLINMVALNPAPPVAATPAA